MPLELGPTVILGHTGFIGRALNEHLVKSGVEVRGYSSAMLDLRLATAFQALDGVLTPETTLVLVSALAPPKGNSLDGFAENLAMVVNLGRYLEGHPVGKLVYFSTDGIYQMIQEPVTEESPLDLTSYYGLGKIAGEQVLGNVARLGGFALLVLRPTGVYGPGDTHSSYGPNRFIRTIVSERKVRLFGEGEESRDHIYIADVVRLAAQLAASDATGAYNLATGASRTFASIVDDLREIVPYDFEVEHAPRSGPITHRRFNLARIGAQAPDLQFTALREGLGLSLAWAQQEALARP